ncbi:MAG: ParA family protein [Anaerolineales bacterium]|nr:ParA family protein [Anaerolineales bacterium]
MRTVIAVSNQKGGVAKTTTCVSLGAAMVERGFEVLAVDLDPQANLSLALGLPVNGLRRGAADVLLGNLSAVSVSRATAIAGLDVLPANSAMHLVERFLTVRQDYEYTLRSALAAAHTFEIVLVDCPPSTGAIPYTALTAANMLLIPTQCEYFSTHGLGEVLDLVRRVRARTNPQLSYRIVVTMFDRGNRVHRGILDQLRGAFGAAVLDTTIDIDPKLRESQVFGQPITSYAPSSRAAQQYRALADELSVYVRREPSAQPA